MKRIVFKKWVFLAICLIVLLFGLAACGPSRTVVAKVNGERITVKDVQDELARLPVEIRPVYEQNPVDVLNRLIALSLLLQEAKRKGLVDSTDLRGLNNPSVQEGMRRLLEPEIKDVKVADQEVAAFYRQHREEMEGKALSQVREPIRKMILEQKQQQRINDCVEKLRVAAVVTTYPERLPKPPSPPLEPSTAGDFDKALKSGRPTMVDFGSNRCIPCIQLRPVLKAVKDAHGNRINVIFIETNENRALALQYQVRLIPTLIFFDAKGREVQRKTGFMNLEAIERVLRDLKLLTG